VATFANSGSQVQVLSSRHINPFILLIHRGIVQSQLNLYWESNATYGNSGPTQRNDILITIFNGEARPDLNDQGIAGRRPYLWIL
jgi:hypothetical protein